MYNLPLLVCTSVWKLHVGVIESDTGGKRGKDLLTHLYSYSQCPGEKRRAADLSLALNILSLLLFGKTQESVWITSQCTTSPRIQRYAFRLCGELRSYSWWLIWCLTVVWSEQVQLRFYGENIIWNKDLETKTLANLADFTSLFIDVSAQRVAPWCSGYYCHMATTSFSVWPLRP